MLDANNDKPEIFVTLCHTQTRFLVCKNLMIKVAKIKFKKVERKVKKAKNRKQVRYQVSVIRSPFRNPQFSYRTNTDSTTNAINSQPLTTSRL